MSSELDWPLFYLPPTTTKFLKMSQVTQSPHPRVLQGTGPLLSAIVRLAVCLSCVLCELHFESDTTGTLESEVSSKHYNTVMVDAY